MAEHEIDEDELFADIYDDDAAPEKPSQPPAFEDVSKSTGAAEVSNPGHSGESYVAPSPHNYVAATTDTSGYYGNDGHGGMGHDYGNSGGLEEQDEDDYGAIGIKEDGKMFIGGLNWETTDESLRDYFSQFGEVTECTVMRDGASGRSRGFGFLTFKDPKTVNTVMVKEHFLDGKIIDPKRAIPREEQERTAKIFVGGVSPEATELDFKNFFTQFGRVIDATLMMDKDTGRPRGFGFVTFDGDEAVDRALARTLEIKGKQIEVKRAQPRSTLQAQAQEERKFGRPPGGFGRGNDGGFDQSAGMGGMQGGPAAMGQGSITPAVMAKYWHNMQQYFKVMQQQMATGGGGGGGGMPPGGAMGMPSMAGMNPMMAANMMAMAGGAPPNVDGSQMNQGPSAAMMGQNMQQMMGGGGQQNQGGNGGFDDQSSMTGGSNQDYGGSNQDYGESQVGVSGGQSSNFDREKYERREAQRMQQGQYQAQQASYGQAGPTSWDGMYDDIPQPNMGQGGGQRGGFGRGGYVRGGRQQNTPPVQQPSNAPANAPTGPKNAGRPGSNYRGGGRGSHRGFHPYSR